MSLTLNLLRKIHCCKNLNIVKISSHSQYTTKTSETHTQFTSLQCGAILRSLTNIKSLAKGRQLHAYVNTSGVLLDNTYLNTKLAAFYASCGQMREAHFIFDQIIFKNSFLWNSMIRGYACSGCSIKSLALYREMFELGQKADNFTYPFVLKACGDLLLVEIGERVHGELVVGGFESDVYVANSLLAMYSKFGDMVRARLVFDKMPVRDLTSYNTMISGYVRNNDAREALVIFKFMSECGIVVDGTTLLGVLSACSNLGALKQGKEIHGCVIRNRQKFRNEFLVNSLIEMYCSCRCIAFARRMFEKLTEKDVVSWNSMISGYAKIGDAFESLCLFCQLILEGETLDQVTLVSVLGACEQITALDFGMSVHSYLVRKGFDEYTIVETALVDMYSKCGSLTLSRRAFDEIPQKNLIQWSAMVAGYGIHGRGRDAVSLFREMVAQSITPDEGVITSVLSACSHSGLVVEGKEIFDKMTKDYNLTPALTHYSCMVDLLGRAGDLGGAYELIDSMKVDPTGDIWAALLSACQRHNNVELAETVAQKVFDTKPQEVGSYVCLSNIYASERRWVDVERVREIVRNKGLRKTPGCSFVELDKVMYRFLVGDRSHQQTKEIYSKLYELNQLLKRDGYKPDTSSVFYHVAEEIKEKMLWEHSERLAIAFALINTSSGTVIRITKNLRVCKDCHTVTKLISKLTGREIVMRDIRRFHHFKDGFCSCSDYW